MKTLLLKTLAGISLVALAILVPSCATDPNAPQVYHFDPNYAPSPAYQDSWAEIDAGWARIEGDRQHRELMRTLDENNRQLEQLNQRRTYRPTFSAPTPYSPRNSYIVPGNPNYLPR